MNVVICEVYINIYGNKQDQYHNYKPRSTIGITRQILVTHHYRIVESTNRLVKINFHQLPV